MQKPFIIGVDFDGTIADHVYPEIGVDVPGAIKWLHTYMKEGGKLLLWTMRSDQYLRDAVQWCRSHNLQFWGININPTQSAWTNSPKAYVSVSIDDNNACCPLVENPRKGGRPYVNWDVVGPAVHQQLIVHKERWG